MAQIYDAGRLGPKTRPLWIRPPQLAEVTVAVKAHNHNVWVLEHTAGIVASQYLLLWRHSTAIDYAPEVCVNRRCVVVACKS